MANDHHNFFKQNASKGKNSNERTLDEEPAIVTASKKVFNARDTIGD